jgi:hypothetical protein
MICSKPDADTEVALTVVVASVPPNGQTRACSLLTIFRCRFQQISDATETAYECSSGLSDGR